MAFGWFEDLTGGGTVYAPLEVIIITFFEIFGHLLFFGDFFKKASESIIF